MKLSINIARKICVALFFILLLAHLKQFSFSKYDWNLFSPETLNDNGFQSFSWVNALKVNTQDTNPILIVKKGIDILPIYITPRNGGLPYIINYFLFQIGRNFLFVFNIIVFILLLYGFYLIQNKILISINLIPLMTPFFLNYKFSPHIDILCGLCMFIYSVFFIKKNRNLSLILFFFAIWTKLLLIILLPLFINFENFKNDYNKLKGHFYISIIMLSITFLLGGYPQMLGRIFEKKSTNGAHEVIINFLKFNSGTMPMENIGSNDVSIINIILFTSIFAYLFIKSKSFIYKSAIILFLLVIIRQGENLDDAHAFYQLIIIIASLNTNTENLNRSNWVLAIFIYTIALNIIFIYKNFHLLKWYIT